MGHRLKFAWQPAVLSVIGVIGLMGFAIPAAAQTATSRPATT